MAATTQSITHTKPAPVTAHEPFKSIYASLFYLRTLLSQTIGFLFYVPLFMRQHPSYTPAQCDWMSMMQLSFNFRRATRTGDDQFPDQTAPESWRDQFVLVKPGPAALYQGPLLGDPSVRPVTVSGCWYPSAYNPTADASKRVILHLHGGGYTGGSWKPDTAGAPANTLAQATDSKVFASSYRKTVARGNHFPAQLQDAVTAYSHLLLLGIPAAKIVLSGDSAGSNLVLALLRYMSEYPHAVPVPAAAVLYSPWLDLSMTAKEWEADPNVATDFLPPAYLEYAAQALVPLNVDPAHPYISPGRKPFKLPVPAWVEVGTLEMFYAGIVAWVNVQRQQFGNDVELYEVRDGIHDVFWNYHCFGQGSKVEESAVMIEDFLRKRRL